LRWPRKQAWRGIPHGGNSQEGRGATVEPTHRQILPLRRARAAGPVLRACGSARRSGCECLFHCRHRIGNAAGRFGRGDHCRGDGDERCGRRKIGWHAPAIIPNHGSKSGGKPAESGASPLSCLRVPLPFLHLHVLPKMDCGQMPLRHSQGRQRPCAASGASDRMDERTDATGFSSSRIAPRPLLCLAERFGAVCLGVAVAYFVHLARRQRCRFLPPAPAARRAHRCTERQPPYRRSWSRKPQPAPPGTGRRRRQRNAFTGWSSRNSRGSTAQNGVRSGPHRRGTDLGGQP